jgi:hypothetical protein
MQLIKEIIENTCLFHHSDVKCAAGKFFNRIEKKDLHDPSGYEPY